VNGLDILLLGLAVVAAVAGWRQGLIGGVLSFAGFLGGAFVGVLAAPILVGERTGLLALLIGIGVVVLGAGIGNALAVVLGGWIRGLVSWEPARALDSVAGSAFGVATVALVAWVVASALVVVPLGPVSAQLRGSTVLGSIDAVLPQQPRDWVSGLRSSLDASGLPQAFSGFVVDPVIPVEAPDPEVLAVPAVRDTWGSLVKIEGVASACGQLVDGSGFTYATQRVMTNAHVVAGVDRPRVLVAGSGESLEARVVHFDPDLDVAVLLVPELRAAPLRFSGEAERGDRAVVAGFPGGGALTAEPARIRARISARGTDIYGRGSVTRDVFSLRATVLPGNSGGPLLSPTGEVDGVVFATSVADPETGYALTAQQVQAAARAGAESLTPVATGSCATR
jgi:S1-C subfamily serine protease